MDYRTAAALSQNIAGIGDAFMQMNDPAARAKAALVGNQNALLASQVEGQGIENQYRPGLFTAQTAAANGSAAQAIAGGRLNDAQTANWGIRNQAGQAALNGFIQVPTTSYSQGGAAGPDEMTDRYTEQGYSSTGRNLSPGVVAVNPSVYPIGTVLQGPDGKTYIAADKHGNKDPNVVDMYRLPQEYKAQSGNQQLRVVGQEKIPYGTTPAQLAEMRAKYERQAGLSNIFNGGGAADLATGTAKMAALNAPDEISARRALAAQGVAMNQGEYFEPGLSTAFQARDLTNNLDQERLEQGGAMDRTLVENGNKARIAILNAGVGSGGDGGNGLAPKSFSDAKSAAEMASEISKQAFGVSEKDGQLVDDIYNPQRSAYAQSVNNLLLDGRTPMEAKAMADAHHFGGTPAVQTEDGMFSDPSSNFKTAEPIPRQAGAVGGSRMDNALSLGQQLFGGGEQAAAAPPAEQPIPVTIARPAEPVPQTGVDKPAPKASDEFKRKQSSGEAKAEKGKSADIQKLEGRIKELTGMLKSGNATTIRPGVYGAGTTKSEAMSNDAYNARLAELQKLEGELAALKSPAQTASQGGVRRYNPATGTIE